MNENKQPLSSVELATERMLAEIEPVVKWRETYTNNAVESINERVWKAKYMDFLLVGLPDGELRNYGYWYEVSGGARMSVNIVDDAGVVVAVVPPIIPTGLQNLATPNNESMVGGITADILAAKNTSNLPRIEENKMNELMDRYGFATDLGGSEYRLAWLRLMDRYDRVPEELKDVAAQLLHGKETAETTEATPASDGFDNADEEIIEDV